MANKLMATPKKFTMQGVFEILLRRPSDGKLLAYLTDAKTSGLENTVDMAYPTGGRGNVYIGGGFAYNRKATFNVTLATFSTSVMAIQNGTEIATGSTEATKYDRIKADAAGNFYSTYKAIGAKNNEIGWIDLLGKDGMSQVSYVQASEPAPGCFAYDPETKLITFSDEDAPLPTDVIGFAYTWRTASNAQKLEMRVDSIPDVVRVTAFGIAKDSCDGTTFPCQLEGIAQVDGNWNFDLDAGGDPVVQNLSMEFVKGCLEEKLYDFIVYTEDEDLVVPNTITLSVPTGDLLGKDAKALTSNLDISPAGVVTGTLNYVTGYTGFSSDPTEQDGYYFPFKVDVPEGLGTAKATMQVGKKPPKDLDLNDGIAVVFMGNSESVAKSKTIALEIDWDAEGTKYPTENLVFDMRKVMYAPK